MNPTFKRSADTDALMLALAGINNDVSYKLLAQQADLPVSRTKQLLPSARRALLRERKIVFGVLRGYGLKRLDESEKIDASDDVKKRIRRAAGRGLRVLGAFNFAEATSNRDRVRHSTNTTIMTLIRSQTTALKEQQPEPKPQATAPDTSKLRAIGGGKIIVRPDRPTATASIPLSGSIVLSFWLGTSILISTWIVGRMRSPCCWTRLFWK